MAYGFRASIAPQLGSVNYASQQANVYSLLFDGQLWAFVRGRRIELGSGPIMVAALQFLQLIREMILPWEEGRPAYQRVRSTTFLSALRLESDRQTTLTLGIETGGSITIPALDFSEVALPTLRLLSDLIRAVLSVDRSQARNLKLVGLRNEVRELRRKVQTHQRVHCIINQDPERLRSLYLSQDENRSDSAVLHASDNRLRFDPRWRLELNALEADSTYLCGSCLVVASTRGAIAINRDDGEILWQRRELSNAWMMAGTTLVRLSVDNDIELVSVDDGRTLTYERLARHGLAPVTALLATASVTPPIAILKEGQGHLVGMDLRNGELRWRLPIRPHDNVCLERSGHMLCVVNGDNSLHAIDITTGETLWRFQDRVRFMLKPVLINDTLIAVSGDRETAQPVMYGIDGLSGYLRWKEPLQGVLASPPLNFEQTVGVCLKREDEHELRVFDPESGNLLWSQPDPGVASGAASLAIDQTLIVNAPWGRVTSYDLTTGVTNWSQPLAINDQNELPPRLNPVLRGGALFVPSSSVHVLRPSDGALLSGALACDLIPDFLRVDERGWVYVGEESGLLSAFAPTPHLRLLRGDR